MAELSRHNFLYKRTQHISCLSVLSNVVSLWEVLLWPFTIKRKHFIFSFFFLSRVCFFFSEKLMACLYNENILISTLTVSINTINIINISDRYAKIGTLHLMSNFFRDCHFLLIKINIYSSAFNTRNQTHFPWTIAVLVFEKLNICVEYP